jgi:hypothetical protein
VRAHFHFTIHYHKSRPEAGRGISPAKSQNGGGQKMRRRNLIAFMKGRENAPNEAIGKMVGLHGLSLDTRNAPNEAKFHLDRLCGLLTTAGNRST